MRCCRCGSWVWLSCAAPATCCLRGLPAIEISLRCCPLAHAAVVPLLAPALQIGLIQFCISPPKSDLENNVIVSDYTQMDRVYKEERNYILNIVKKVKASGCNVLLIQKSILRDAVTDLALHYLVSGDPPWPY